MLIGDEQIAEALTMLSVTDSTVAGFKAAMKAKEYQRQTMKSLAYLEAEQDAIRSGERWSVAKKEAVAMQSEKYQKWCKDFEDAVADYEILNNERNTAILKVEIWRSEQANRRRGNV